MYKKIKLGLCKKAYLLTLVYGFLFLSYLCVLVAKQEAFELQSLILLEGNLGPQDSLTRSFCQNSKKKEKKKKKKGH